MAKSFSKGTVRLNNAAELRDALKSLPPKLQKKILRSALRAGAKPVHAAVKANAPVETGKLRNSIFVRAATKMRRGTVGVKVVAGDKEFQGDTFYGSFLEFGYFQYPTVRIPFVGVRTQKPLVKSRRVFRPGLRWMGRAFDAVAPQAGDAIERHIVGKVSEHFRTEAK